MNRKLIFGLSVALLTSFITTNSLHAIEPGQKIPDLTLPTLAGPKIGLGQFSGKIIYLDIWASWCGTCVKSLAWMQSLQEKFGKDTFQVIAVNVDEVRSDAERILKEANASLLVALDPDGATPAALNVEGVPTSYLIGRDGRVISVHQGLKDEDQNEIENKIMESLSKDT